MTTINKLLRVTSTMTDKFSNQLSRQPHEATKVYIRLMFVRLGDIDTLNEKYYAQVCIEARWSVEFDKLSSNLLPDDQKRLADGKSASLHKYAESHWHPHLYIENALGDPKEYISYTAKKSKYDNDIYVCEHREVTGAFWEKLELQHFPADVQDLSISIASTLHDDRVVLYADPHLSSGVNPDRFIDQQEWSLYKHVDIEARQVEEFLLRGSNAEDDEDDDSDDEDNNVDRKLSMLTVTCHAARHSNYFYWNGCCLIFLITIVSFCVYTIPPNIAATRIQISTILLLTSITFRWVVNKTLPTLCYLTLMDIYAITCIIALVIQTVWHGIIGALIFLETPDYRLTSDLWFVRLDTYVLFVVIGIFVIMHIVIITWLYMVPYKYRRDMAEKDKNYKFVSSKKEKRKSKQTGKSESRKSSDFSRIPIDKTLQY